MKPSQCALQMPMRPAFSSWLFIFRFSASACVDTVRTPTLQGDARMKAMQHACHSLRVPEDACHAIDLG